MARDEVENIDETVIEDMGKGYRFRPFMQAVILCVIILATAFILYLAKFLDFKQTGDLTITTLAFCWVLAFLFPFIAKTRTHRVRQIAMGIFLAAIFSFIGTIILLIIDQGTVAPTSIALLIAFLAGIGAQLYEHLNPELVKRNALMYLAVFGVSVVFFVCTWIYLENLLPGWGIWIAIVITALFAYALLPEKPK